MTVSPREHPYKMLVNLNNLKHNQWLLTNLPVAGKPNLHIKHLNTERSRPGDTKSFIQHKILSLIYFGNRSTVT